VRDSAVVTVHGRLGPMTAHPDSVDPTDLMDASADDRGLTPRARAALERLPPALARMRLTVRGAYFLYGLACALLSVVGTVFGVAWLGMIVVGIVRGVLA